MLFLFVSVSDKTWTSEKIKVPDGVTALRAVALVMSDNLGLGFTPVPQKVTKYSICASIYFIVSQFQDISHKSCCFLLRKLRFFVFY